jgi:hypothetical protein
MILVVVTLIPTLHSVEMNYAGVVFDYVDGSTPNYFTTNNTFFWFTDTTFNRVYKYWVNGTSTSTYFSVCNTPKGITTNNTFIWIRCTGANGLIAKYLMDGTYVSNFTGNAAYDNANGITQNGTFIFGVDANDNKIYLSFMNGTDTGRSISLTGSIEDMPANGNAIGVATNNTFLWVTDTNKLVYKYNMSGTLIDYINKSTLSSMGDIVMNATFFWIIDTSEEKIYRYYVNYLDTVKPTFTTIPANATITYGNEFLNQTFVGTDDVEFDTYSVNNTLFKIDSTGNLSINRTSQNRVPGAWGDDYNEWNFPGNASVSDDLYATVFVPFDVQDWYNFSFVIPDGETIEGIKVVIEGHFPSGNHPVTVDLSWDGGTTYTTTKYNVTSYTTAYDIISILGGEDDTWGRTWSSAEFSNSTFRVRMNSTSIAEFDLDAIEVRVYYEDLATLLPMGVYRMNVTINDTSNNINWTTYQVTVVSDNPSYASASHNNTQAGELTRFGINVTDNLALHPNGQWIFSTNNTGTWVNDSAVNFITTPSWANVTKTLNSSVGKTIGYRWYFNDSAGNRNSTSIYTLTTTDNIEPYFTTIPANVSIFYGNQSVSVDFDATDAVGFGYFKINDTRFSITQAGVLTNATPLAVNTYLINVSINDTSNNNNWTFYRVQVNKSNYYNCGVYFNDTSGLDYPGIFKVYTNCSSAYTLTRNGTAITNASTQNLSAGAYNFSVQRIDTANYTNNFDDQYFTIDKGASICGVYFNATTGIDYPDTFKVYTNCSSAYTLKRNGTTITNNSVQANGAGTFNFSVQRTDTVNYTNNYWDEEFTVDKSPEHFKVLFNASSPLVYPNVFRVWHNSTSTTTLKRNGTTISNNSVQINGAGYFNFSAQRTDTANYTNNFDDEFFTITNGTLTGTTASSAGWTLTYPTQTTISFSETNGGDGNVNYYLWRNGTNISSGETVNLSVGMYTYVLNSTGGANYSSIASIDNDNLTINKNTGECNVLFNATSPLTYPNVFRVYTDCSSAYKLYRNGTEISNNNSVQINGAGYFNYTVQRTDTVNFTNNFDDEFFTVNPVTPTLTKLLNKANSDFTGTVPIQVNASGLTNFGTLTMTRNGTNILAQNNVNTSYPAGYYDFAFGVTGNANITSISALHLYATINQNTTSCGVYFNTSSSINYPDKFIVYTNCTTAYNLYRNGTSISNASVQDNGAGYYNFTVQRTDTVNYTNTVNSQFFTVNNSSDSCSVYFNATSPITHPDFFIAYTNCSSAYTFTRNGTTISNATTINSGATAYNFSVQRTDTANYTNVFHQSEFRVNKNEEMCQVLFNDTSPIEYTKTFLVWANCTSPAFVLSRNGTTIVNNSEQDLALGLYNFSMQRNDTANYTIYFDETTMEVNDTTAPISTVDMYSPPAGASYVNDTWSKDNVQIVISASDTGIGYDALAFPVFCTDAANTCEPSTFIALGETVSTEGTTYIRYYTNDSYGNKEETQFRVIKIDKTNATVSILYPTENLNFSSELNIPFNFSTADNYSGLDTCLYSLDGGVTNVSTTCNVNITINATEGSNTLTLFVNDTVNNWNSTSVTFTVDLTNPLITFGTGVQNNTYMNNNFIFTNVSVTETNEQNITFYLYYSNYSLANASTYTDARRVINWTGLTDGLYYFNVTLFDYVNQSNSTETYVMTLDKTMPNISYNPTSDANQTFRMYNWIFINVTANDTNKDSVRWSLDNVNETFTTNNVNYYWENKTGLSEGNHSFYAWVNDSAGNYNSTSNYTVIIDLTNPDVEIVYPIAGTYNYNESFPLNISINDTNLDKCWYNLDDTANITIDCYTNITFNTTENVHTIYLFANDSSGREGNDVVTFTISLAPPGVTLNYPTDTYWWNTNNIYFNYTPSDASLDICQFWTNTTGTWHINYTDTSPVSDAINNISLYVVDGQNYIWNVWCNDSGANGAWGGATNYSFSVDTIYPLISYGAGVQNDTNTTRNFLNINVSATDTNEKNITFYLYYSNYSIANSSTYTDARRTINWTNIVDGLYYFNSSIFDYARHTNITPTYQIRFDDTDPIITINSPLAQNYGTNNSMLLNYTVTDNLIGIDTCWYYIYFTNGTLVKNTEVLTGCVNDTFTLPGGDNNFTLTLFSRDILYNTDYKTVTFGIRTNSPVIVLSPTTNAFSSSASSNYFNYTVTTLADNISSCALWTNTTGVWHRNQTQTSSIFYNGTKNVFNAITVSEGAHMWNVWCNDSFNNSGWGLTNNTFTVDLTNPVSEITVINTPNSQTFTFNTSVNDTYLDICKYSIINSTNVVDGLNSNVTFTCNALSSATTTNYGLFTLLIFAYDEAGNENSTRRNFTLTRAATVVEGGGGGGSVIVIGNLSWAMYTETGSDRYQFNMLKRTSRSRDILFENMGATPLVIEVSCQYVSGSENLCDSVAFEYLSFELPVETGIAVPVEFTINLPDELVEGDYVINIVGTDDLGNPLAVTTEVNVGTGNKISDIPSKLLSSKLIFGIKIPYMLIFLTIWIILSVIISYVYKKFKVIANVGLGAITALFISLLLIVFI